jgi:UPF0755 protein
LLKRTLTFTSIGVLLAVVVFAAVVYRGVTSEGRGEGTVRVTIARGEPFGAVLDDLAGTGLVASPWALRVYASLRGYDRRVKRGTYQFDFRMRPVDILHKMVAGEILLVPVTVPEGFTIWDIAAAFERAGLDSTEMLDALTDAGTRERRRIEAPSLEGYLFPDTYHVPWGAPPREVVSMMLGRLDEVFTADLLQRAADIGMTPNEVLTLSSIIEAETRIPAERPLVSAVYHNRLKKRMRLEADPTVAYAMGGYKGRLLYADLEIDSPYNTYKHYGLPPGPICSPGEASIHAALYPDSTLSALYFVARGDGSHIFSITLREHRAAVERVRRARLP